MGFLIPPMIVRNGTAEEIGYELSVMYYGTGAVTIAIFILAVFCKSFDSIYENLIHHAANKTFALCIPLMFS